MTTDFEPLAAKTCVRYGRIWLLVPRFCEALTLPPEILFLVLSLQAFSS